MRISVPRQFDEQEKRVSITPDVAARLIGSGHSVDVARGAGEGAGHTDDDYVAVGARLVDAEEAWSSDLVATVDRPGPDVTVAGALIGLLRPFDDPVGIASMAKGGATIFAFEAVPRTTRAQVLDALSSQATVAGYQAVLEGAALSDRLFPMLTTSAGTIRPARVLVLGAGVAGLQAIATARRLGAIVSAFDVRSAAAEQVRSLGASFVEVDSEPQDASTSGGYAREVGADQQSRILAALAPHVTASDVVISTAAIPGRSAPILIDTAMVAGMRRGAVIIDLAASTGGNCEATKPGSTVVHNGVVIVGDTDIVSRVARDASAMYARNVSAFVDLVAGDDGSYLPDWDDDIVAETCVARDGAVVHPRIAPGREEETT